MVMYNSVWIYTSRVIFVLYCTHHESLIARHYTIVHSPNILYTYTYTIVHALERCCCAIFPLGSG